jgi:hypothetical protein
VRKTQRKRRTQTRPGGGTAQRRVFRKQARACWCIYTYQGGKKLRSSYCLPDRRKLRRELKRTRALVAQHGLPYTFKMKPARGIYCGDKGRVRKARK